MVIICMQQFLVPQFIESEDKILGPVTVRQFLLMLLAGFIAFLAFRFADFSLFVLITIADIIILGVLAFVKVNGVAFHYFLLNVLQTLKRPNLRVWNRDVTDADVRAALRKPKELQVSQEIQVKSMIGASRLSELSLIVDTGGTYRGETVLEELNQDKKVSEKKK